MTTNLQPLARGNTAATPQSCNIDLACEICGRRIPAGEQYLDVQAGHGSGQVCSDHDLDDICEWTGEE